MALKISLQNRAVLNDRRLGNACATPRIPRKRQVASFQQHTPHCWWPTGFAEKPYLPTTGDRFRKTLTHPFDPKVTHGFWKRQPVQVVLLYYRRLP